MLYINTIPSRCEAFKLFQQERALFLKFVSIRACVNNYFLEWILSFWLIFRFCLYYVSECDGFKECFQYIFACLNKAKMPAIRM